MSTKFEVMHTTTKEQLDGAREALSKGDFSGGFTIVKATVLGNVPGLNKHYEAEEKDRLANELLGIEKVEVAEVVRRLMSEGKYNGAYF